jgi:hypothetical protein
MVVLTLNILIWNAILVQNCRIYLIVQKLVINSGMEPLWQDHMYHQFSFLVEEILIHNFLLAPSASSCFSSTGLIMSPPSGNGFNLHSLSLTETPLSSSSSNSLTSSFLPHFSKWKMSCFS